MLYIKRNYKKQFMNDAGIVLDGAANKALLILNSFSEKIIKATFKHKVTVIQVYSLIEDTDKYDFCALIFKQNYLNSPYHVFLVGARRAQISSKGLEYII